MKYYGGIDVGKKGYFSIIDENGKIIECKPLYKDIKKAPTHELCDCVDHMITEYQMLLSHVVIEDVHSIFGASAKSNFEFGFVAGAVESIIVAYRVPYSHIQPKAWQRVLYEGIRVVRMPSKSGKTEVNDTKSTSINVCKQLWPDYDLRRTERCQKPDDNKCDSLLMAEYARRKNL